MGIEGITHTKGVNPMLRLKITVCSLLALSLIAAGALFQNRLHKERFHFYMQPPIPDGSYIIYNDFEPGTEGVSYSPYRPREYVRIIHRSSEFQP